MKYNRLFLISSCILVLMASIFHSATAQALSINTAIGPTSNAYGSPVAQDPYFKDIMSALGHSTPSLTIPFEGGTYLKECYAGRYEILQKLDAIRAEHPEWFENLDYGPVEKGGQHQGVALYPKQTGPNPDYSPDGYMKAVKNGVVIDYTNYWSNWTGGYTCRSWGEWSWNDFLGKGGLLTGGIGANGRTPEKSYWNPTGPDYTQGTSPPSPAPPNQPALQPHFTITASISVTQSCDPNEKVGATGIAAERYLSGEEPLRYTIFFENVRDASAAAQVVKITDQLETANLDLTTFSFGPISFGDKEYFPPGNSKEFLAEIDLRPEKNLIARLNAKLDEMTNLLTWELKSIDPDTGQIPLDPSVGILPPNVNPPEGEGSVTFVVMPKKGVAAGTSIRNRSTIIFDLNAPIETNEWVNVIDNTKPSSQVLSLASSQPSPTFPVTWVGQDAGAGIKDYTIFVSKDGGPYAIWLSDTTATNAQFTGEAGKTYAFYSISRDGAYNIEHAKTSPDATTTVSVPQMKSICSYLGNDPKPSILDQDVFRFQGTTGEEITILLEAKPASAKKATLLLVDKITGAVFLRADLSALPNHIKTKLPKTGEYLIIVSEQINVPRGAAYRGDYCLTLKARYETNNTLTPYKWVE